MFAGLTQPDMGETMAFDANSAVPLDYSHAGTAMLAIGAAAFLTGLPVFWRAQNGETIARKVGLGFLASGALLAAGGLYCLSHS